MPPRTIAALEQPQFLSSAFPLGDHLRWSDANGTVEVAGWFAPGEAKRCWASRPGSLTATSGQMFANADRRSSIVLTAASLATHFESGAHADPEAFGGVFTLLHVGSDGRGFVTADPFGMGPVYRAETPRVTVIGTRADLVASVASATGGSLARDLDSMRLLAFTGTLQGDGTGYEDVKLLPPSSVLKLRARGTQTLDRRPTFPWAPVRQMDLEEALRLALERLRIQVHNIVTSHGPDVFTELTGGKDSRLVLALLLAEGLANQVECRTWGEESLKDVQVACDLAHEFELNHRTKSGLTRRRARSDQPTLEPDTGHDPDWRVRHLSVEEEMRHQVWLSAGCLSIWDLVTPTWPPPGRISMSGLGGEVLRSNYPNTDRLTTDGLLRRFLRSGGFGFNSANLMTRDSALTAREAVGDLLSSTTIPPGDARDAIDSFYICGRLRRWAALQIAVSTRPRLLPLLDVEVARTAFAVSADVRRSGILQFELVARSSPRLAEAPFAGQGWPPGVARFRENFALADTHRRQLPVQVENELYRVRRLFQRSSVKPIARLARRRRPEATAAERNRMRDLEEKRAALSQLLAHGSDHPAWEIYDRTRTLRALAHIEELPTQGRAEVHHAATVATWLDRGERPGQPFERT